MVNFNIGMYMNFVQILVQFPSLFPQKVMQVFENH